MLMNKEVENMCFSLKTIIAKWAGGKTRVESKFPRKKKNRKKLQIFKLCGLVPLK